MRLKIIVFVLASCALFVGCKQEPTVPIIQIRVSNQTEISFAKLWLGAGGSADFTTLYESIGTGEISEYKPIGNDQRYYGKVNVTTTEIERLSTVNIRSPVEDGTVI